MVTDELLAKFFSGEATPEEAMMIEDWNDESPVNLRYFNDCAKILSKVAVADSVQDISNALKKLRTETEDRKTTKMRSLRIWRMGIAASVILLLAVTIVIYRTSKNEERKVVYQAGVSQQKIMLSDLTSVVLAPYSTLTIAKEYGKINRHISFSGSAFFNVLHDPSRPMIIDMDNFWLEDLGTQFYINTSNNEDTVVVYVHEGKVALYDNRGTKLVLQAGEMAAYIRSAKELAPLPQIEKTNTRLSIDKAPAAGNTWRQQLMQLCDTCVPKLPAPPDSARAPKNAANSKEAADTNDLQTSKPAKPARVTRPGKMPK